MRPVAALTMAAVLALALVSAARADWDHPVKWDQLEPDATYVALKTYVYDTTWELVADDFLCSETGWITDIEFDGWTTESTATISSFRITFWSDVPATVDEESHPADQPLRTIDVARADPNDPLGLGWHHIDSYRFKINLPEELWFFQEEGTVYWIGIQGLMNDDEDTFRWVFRDRDACMSIDDAVYASVSCDPWLHWGWWDTGAAAIPGSYRGKLPNDWDKSADMSFRLSGIPIPEPASIGLVALALAALVFRRRR